MENASDALIMAGEVLIFIVALTVCISSFTTLRRSIDDIIDQTETVEMAKGSNGYTNYIEAKESNATRIVGAETVVTSMYRSVKENYTVYLNLTGVDAVSKIRNLEANGLVTLTNIDGEGSWVQFTIGENQSVNGILKGPNGNDGLYSVIKNTMFKEYLGEYQNNTEATTENKNTYRIITYVQDTG